VEISSNENTFVLTFDDLTIQAEVLHVESGRLDLLVDGQRLTAYVSSQNSRRWVTVNGRTLLLTRSSGARGRGSGPHQAAGELTAPMPGQVRAVNVNEGDTVTKGQTLMLLEAMKMEIRIQSPQEGVVKKLFVSQGQTVEREQVLIKIEES
jgi:biotin carboxyl carrier protein